MDPGSSTSRVPVPATRREIGRLLAAIVLVAAFAELSYTTVNISAMAVYIRDDIRLDTRWIGIAAGAFIAVEGILKSPFGVLGDYVGRKKLIYFGPAVSVFTAVATPHVHNPYLLVLLRVLDGVGAAALWPAAFSLIGDYVPEERRSAAMSYFNLAYLLGIALGPALGGGVNDWTWHHHLMSHRHSKEASFYVAAVLFLATTIIAMMFVPDVRPKPHGPQDPGGSVEGGASLKAFTMMLRRIPAMLLMTFVTFLAIGLVMAYFKVFAMDQLQVTEGRFGVLLIGPALVIAALSVPLGTLGDRIGKPLAVKIGLGLCVVSFWTVMALLALQQFSEIALVVLGSLLGIGFIIAFPSWMAIVSTDCEESQRGAAVGAVGTAQGLGAIIGVGISSRLYNIPKFTLGPLDIPTHGAPFLGCAIMLAFAFVLALFAVRDRRVSPVTA